MFQTKKSSVVLFCIIITLLSSCNPVIPKSEDQLYAEHMTSVLEMIDSYQSGPLKSWENILAKPSEDLGTYKEILGYHIIAMPYLIQGEPPSIELQEIGEAADSVFQSAYDIQVELGAIKVPAAMAVPHSEVTKCITSITEYYSVMSRIGKGEVLLESELNILNENNCNKFDVSIDKIREFITTI